LSRFGQGKKLIDAPEFAPLDKFADRRLTSIGYTSKAFNAQVNPGSKDIDGYLELANEMLKAVDLPADLKTRLHKDLTDLAKDLKANMPAAGAAMAFSFLTARGTESYDYNWSEHPHVDSSRPLTLLQHIGGNPALAVVGRSKYSPESYTTL